MKPLMHISDRRLFRPTGRIGQIALFTLLLCCVSMSLPTSVQADEPYLKFVQGLRNRQYYDTAIRYLESLETRKNVPQEIVDRIPYEKAVTLVAGAQFVQNPETQADQLDQAQAYLEAFLKKTPNHKLAPIANTELARIMLGKAQVLIWRSRSPSNVENRSKFQQDARKLITQARGIFQKAHDAYKQEWESYGVFIPEEEKEKRAARADAEGQYMRAQLDLATCTYEEAQTYDEGSDKFNELLRKASLEFEDVHTKYRSQYAGLFARTMQGKCFEEQDDIRKALGIYSELLSHPGQSEGLKKLQHQVLQFRLICLNHESRKDYQLVIQEAEDWLKLNRSYRRTPSGLGIRWELAQAQEALALERTTPEADRTRLLRQALDNAREINKYAGPYKDVSNSMIQRVLVALDREPGDPEDFDTAFGTANNMLEQIGELREKLKAAEKSGNKEEIQKVDGELQALLSETERLYRLALSLAVDGTEGSQINAARYRLAYMFYLQRKSYETAVVGRFLSIRAKDSDPAMALDGAYLAMAGFSQAFNDAPESSKDEVLALMVDICERIAKGWPDSDRAVDARMEMGRIYRRNEQPIEAAKWYAEVPQTVPQYAGAQIEAGQAYWNAYLNAIVSEDNNVSTDELKKWQDEAAKHLRNGINKRQAGVPASNPTPDELTRAKVSLAQIEIMRGNEQAAIDLMTKDPHSVLKAITVADGQARPEETSNVKSTTFASFAYQQLLRAYIGTRQLDKAEEARQSLEKVAGQAGGEALTAVYVELGRELQNELERLKKQGDQQRLNEVRNGFESFLDKLFQRKDGQTYGSLIWIAETYFGLAEGSAEAPQKEKQYYDAAAKTYSEIIKRAGSNPNFIDAARLTGVKLRLVNCKRQAGQFDEAETIVKEILAQNPRALDAQFEAAALYQSWGEAGEADHYMDAVRGKTFDDGAVIWGWGNIAKRLQMLIDSGQGTPEYAERNRESRYRLAESRYQFAEQSSDLTASEEQLKKAKFELLAYTSITPDLPETPWWDRFDTLYQDIQRNLGEAAMPLEKPELITADAGTKSNYDTGTTEPVAQAPAEQATAKPAAEPESNLMSYLLIGLVLLGGLGIVGFTMFGGKKKGKSRSRAEMLASAPSDFKMAPTEPAKPTKRRSSNVAQPTAAAGKVSAAEAASTEKKKSSAPAGEKPVRRLTKEQAAELKRRQELKRRKAAQAGEKPPQQKRPKPKPPEQS